jgi:4-hydroxy-tetrahydrodipicolinate reductase
MKISLIGYGKMGRMVEEAAHEKGHVIVSKIDPKEKYSCLELDSLQNADICIDFSKPALVLDNIKKAALLGVNLVVGTTGWYDQLPKVEEIVEGYGIGVLYSPNFSLGIQLFLKMIQNAAALINLHEHYDVSGYEAHHSQKLDAPSGTAHAIIDLLAKNIDRNRKQEIQFPSIRCGSIPGTHVVIFDSPSDTIELKHVARNRKGFAYGAIAAAEWLQGKKGLFTLDSLQT